MQHHKLRVRSVIAGFTIAGVCLLSFPAAAQQAGPRGKQGTVSDDDFISLNQQIKELKNPTFRVFLRMRLISWEPRESGPTRRRAAMEAVAQGMTDLCDHQDEVWSPTASWLHESLLKQIKTLQSPEDYTIENCFKTETSKVATEFSSGMKMLSEPETSVAGLNLMKSAILSGQISPGAMLGQLLSLKANQSPHLFELLDAVLQLEEKQPGTLPLELMPFFSSMFIEKSSPTEIRTRFISVAVRSSRRSAAEFANPTVRGPVTQLLNGIISPAKELTPALYPEIASRLSSLGGNTLTRTETRLAAEERIQKASDQLEQLIAEADSAPDEGLKRQFFFQAARLAKERGQLNRAVDLATKVTNVHEREKNDTKPSWLNDFLSEIVSLAIKKQSPRDATYAISNMTQVWAKAKAFRFLGEYYGANQDKVKSKEAFTESAKQLKSVNNSNEKVRAFLALAESLLKYEPADAYEVFREAVKAINNLASPEKDQEKMYYVHLMPVAEDLMRSFRLLATRENQTATSLAEEIKLSELRVSALSGVYSGR